MKSYSKLTIKKTYSTPSGNYAEGDGIMIDNRGYNIGDVVEEWYSDEGHEWAVEKIEVNGRVTYTLKDMEKYLVSKDEIHKKHMRETLKEKGIYHKVYNPNP